MAAKPDWDSLDPHGKPEHVREQVLRIVYSSQGITTKNLARELLHQDLDLSDREIDEVLADLKSRGVVRFEKESREGRRSWHTWPSYTGLPHLLRQDDHLREQKRQEDEEQTKARKLTRRRERDRARRREVTTRPTAAT